MIIRTIYTVAPTKHRSNLCRLERSALSVDSMIQAYVDEWFNLPVAGDPG